MRKSTVMLVYFAAVFSGVTQRSPERNGETSQKTAPQETTYWYWPFNTDNALRPGLSRSRLTLLCIHQFPIHAWTLYCLLSFWLHVRQNKHGDISTDVEVEAFWQTNFTFPKHVSFSFFICIRPFTAHFFKEENFGWKRKHKALLVLQVQLWGHGLDVTGATCIVMFCFNDGRYPAVLILLHFLCLVMLCCTILCFVVLSCTIVCFVVLCCAIVCFVARFLSYYTIHCFFSWVGIHENGTNNRSWRFLQLNTRYPKYWQDTNVLKIDFNFDKV